MSNSTSRRRIAGERNGVRPGISTSPTTGTSPTTDSPVLGSHDSVAEPAETPGRPDRRPDRPVAAGRRVRPAVLGGLALLAASLVVLAAGPFVDGLGLGAVRAVAAHEEVDQARRTAPAAAERAAAAILAYDHRSLEADRDAAAAYMTEGYREDYLATFDGTVLENAPEFKARVQADVRASGVSLAEPDRVQVLMFANQTTVSTANGGEPQTALNRVMLTMAQQPDGAWLVDDISSY